MLDGIDPAVEKVREKAHRLTLRKLADEYISDRNLKKNSIVDIEKHLKTSFSDWAGKPIVNINRDKVTVLFRNLSERSSAQTNQAFRILRAMINYAMATYRPDNKPLMFENPVNILSEAKLWNKIKPRSGRIPNHKIGEVWNYLRSIREAPEETTIHHTMSDILCFLMLTGARWSEAAELTWDRVDLSGRVILIKDIPVRVMSWHLPDPKNRNEVTFPLSDVAVKILENRVRKNQYVFPARSDPRGHITDGRGLLNKAAEKIGVPVMIHDLRRTFRAIAKECDIELWKTKLLMNHLSADVTIKHYTETNDLTDMSPEINKIADWVIRQGVIAEADNVIPLKKRR